MLNPAPKSEEEKQILFNYPIVEHIALSRNPIVESKNIFDVVLSRRSKRQLAQIELEDISKLLWFSSKAIHVNVNAANYLLSQRPSPSAGARHPIDILISPTTSEKRKLFYYNSFDHSICELETLLMQEEFFQHISQIMDCSCATVLWFIAHPNRTEAKYENAQSLIWRDSGALLYCVQLVCEALSLKSCQLGSLGEPFISKMFEKFGKVYGCGGLLIGK